MSLTAGAGTRCMSLLPDSPTLVYFISLDELERKREKERKSQWLTFPFPIASWISAHSFQALIINFGSLREYVNGFELPRLKEANIRGRDEPDEPVPDTTDAHQRRRKKWTRRRMTIDEPKRRQQKHEMKQKLASESRSYQPFHRESFYVTGTPTSFSFTFIAYKLIKEEDDGRGNRL